MARRRQPPPPMPVDGRDWPNVPLREWIARRVEMRWGSYSDDAGNYPFVGRVRELRGGGAALIPGWWLPESHPMRTGRGYVVITGDDSVSVEVDFEEDSL